MRRLGMRWPFSPFAWNQIKNGHGAGCRNFDGAADLGSIAEWGLRRRLVEAFIETLESYRIPRLTGVSV